MRYRKLIALAVFAMICKDKAYASSIQSARVVNVVPNNAGVLVFYTDGSRTNVPGCAGGMTSAFAINTNNIAGQTLSASVLTALAARLVVDVGGTGACDIQGNAETAGYIAIHN